jgi:transposase
VKRSQKAGDLATWRRAHAVLGYINGKTVIALCDELDVVRASVNRWLQWYEGSGLEGLKPRKAPGATPRLSDDHRAELVRIIEAGPQEASFMSGVWTGPMIGALIRKRYRVSYHNHHIPRLLHSLGFSVQRPRKRLARADAEAQAQWLRKRLPRIKKKLQLVAAL